MFWMTTFLFFSCQESEKNNEKAVPAQKAEAPTQKAPEKEAEKKSAHKAQDFGAPFVIQEAIPAKDVFADPAGFVGIKNEVQFPSWESPLRFDESQPTFVSIPGIVVSPLVPPQNIRQKKLNQDDLNVYHSHRLFWQSCDALKFYLSPILYLRHNL